MTHRASLLAAAAVLAVACAEQEEADVTNLRVMEIETAEAEDAEATAPEPPTPPPASSLDSVLARVREDTGLQAAAAARREAEFSALSAPSSAVQASLPREPLYFNRLPPTRYVDREEYPDVESNPTKLVSEEPVSTFSVDVDTASYAVVRRYLKDGEAPPSDAVRIEELINYFDYDYPLPESRDAPFALSAAVAPTPWNSDTQILHIGIKGFDEVMTERPRANLVFLIDVSGSMDEPNKLPLVKQSLRLLVDRLEDDDTVSIVVYAGRAGAVLEPTPGAERLRILAAIDQLEAGGSTAGGEGLRLAYAFAEQSFDPEAVNRIILATDGDFNVGVTDNERLEDFVARKRESGVYLSVLGFGTGNYNGARMQTIAQAGNGTAAYIDTLMEARKVLHAEMGSTLFPIANDVKVQLQFNPARVAEYRLIGYETRMLRREDFANDAVDAGEIGAGHEVTALYEIAAPGSAGLRVEESRYAVSPDVPDAYGEELGQLRVRYKLPGETESRLIERLVTDADVVADLADAPAETRWVAAVAAYGQLLKREPYMGTFDFADVVALAQTARGDDPYGYRAELIQLAGMADVAAGLLPLEQEIAAGPQ